MWRRRVRSAGDAAGARQLQGLHPQRGDPRRDQRLDRHGAPQQRPPQRLSHPLTAFPFPLFFLLFRFHQVPPTHPVLGCDRFFLNWFSFSLSDSSGRLLFRFSFSFDWTRTASNTRARRTHHCNGSFSLAGDAQLGVSGTSFSLFQLKLEPNAQRETRRKSRLITKAHLDLLICRPIGRTERPIGRDSGGGRRWSCCCRFLERKTTWTASLERQVSPSVPHRARSWTHVSTRSQPFS